MTQAPRPNRQVRRDWEATRRRWEAERRREQQLAAQRRARAEAAEATDRRREAADRARALAAQSWPPTPVASRYERRLRARYLNGCTRSADVVPAERWLATRASGAPTWMADADALTGISIAMTVLVTIGILVALAVDTDAAIDVWAVVGMVVLSPVVFLLAWIPTTIVLAVLGLVGVISLELAGALRGARQRRMWEDHIAYRTWARQVQADVDALTAGDAAPR
jgi:hypothetical protein